MTPSSSSLLLLLVVFYKKELCASLSSPVLQGGRRELQGGGGGGGPPGGGGGGGGVATCSASQASLGRVSAGACIDSFVVGESYQYPEVCRFCVSYAIFSSFEHYLTSQAYIYLSIEIPRTSPFSTKSASTSVRQATSALLYLMAFQITNWRKTIPTDLVSTIGW